uniref:p450 monooxygenase n=1 Tax=Periglandula ipomoeae TaxID=1037530 RepID=J7FIQ6_9HYPO|nr:P450 monooxygenase [Periglandula ipomoeae]
MLMLHAIVAGIWLLLWYVVYSTAWKESIPTVRCWPSLFPKFLDRLSYNKHAVRLVKHGYEKYKNRPFRLLKMDMDLIVIPLQYAFELRAITSDKLDPLTASFDDNAGKVTRILLGSELHTRAIQRRLTPRLSQTLPIILDELSHAFEQVLPTIDGPNTWIPVNPYELVLNLSTRAAARLFVGEPICRDEHFLETSASYSRNTFDTISTSRSLGHLVTYFLGRWIYTVDEAHGQLQYIQNLLGSEVRRRKDHPEDKRDDFLQWCMDLARTEDEAQPEALGHRTLGILSMAVVHTTAMATTHLLFDMSSDDDLKACLRQEQENVLKQGWTEITQQVMLDMKQLDSLMRESQRVNPVGEFTFRRIVREPITLSDGYQLKPGQQIALPAKCINTDNRILPDAELFEPLRWIKQAGAAPTSFSNSSASNLHFGLGRYACPGRFIASYMIKAITSRILLEYDFKLHSEFASERPPNIIHGDKILPNRTAVILLRRRDDKVSSVERR